MGSNCFFANIRPLESTHNNKERARLLPMARTPPAVRDSLIAIALLWSLSTAAGPTIPAGDVALRHDIQRLADAGVIKGPISTWPLAWGPIVTDIIAPEREEELSAGVLQSLVRVRARAASATQINHLQFNTRLSVCGSVHNSKS